MGNLVEIGMACTHLAKNPHMETASHHDLVIIRGLLRICWRSIRVSVMWKLILPQADRLGFEIIFLRIITCWYSDMSSRFDDLEEEILTITLDNVCIVKS